METPTPSAEEQAATDDNLSSSPELSEEAITELLVEDDAEADELDLDEKPAEVEAEETPPATPAPEGKDKDKTPPAEPKVEEPKPVEVAPTGEKPIGEAPKPTTPPAAVAPTPAPEQKPAETPAPEPAPVTVPVLTPEQQTEAYNTWRTGVEDALAKERYAVTEEEAEGLGLNTESAVAYSKGQARVYMDAVTGAIGHITKAMPQLLEAALHTRDSTSKAEEAFYTAWPKLNSKEHGESINRLGAAYRQLNPTATTEVFIREVGAQSMVALRISPDAAPAAPVVETPAAPSAPFKPAGPGAPSGGALPQPNIFTALSADFDAEEEELNID
jgi:hypothetical protein